MKTINVIAILLFVIGIVLFFIFGFFQIKALAAGSLLFLFVAMGIPFIFYIQKPILKLAIEFNKQLYGTSFGLEKIYSRIDKISKLKITKPRIERTKKDSEKCCQTNSN